MTWTATHVLDEKSPLADATTESLEATAIELVVTFIGIDNTLAQTVHARHGYRSQDIRFGERFVDMFGVTESGRRLIDYGNFHSTVPDTTPWKS